MTEGRAIVLTIGTMVVAVLVSTGVLTAIGADPTLPVLAFVLILVLGADTCSRIAGHYDKEPRR